LRSSDGKSTARLMRTRRISSRVFIAQIYAWSYLRASNEGRRRPESNESASPPR
jgi:hypothetical protein